MNRNVTTSQQISPIMAASAAACAQGSGVSAYFYGYWFSHGLA
jgi:hypothetical protein